MALPAAGATKGAACSTSTRGRRRSSSPRAWRSGAGRPYEEFTYESFAQAEIARLEELRLDAVEARVEADLRRGLAAELVGELEGLVRQHPFREGLDRPADAGALPIGTAGRRLARPTPVCGRSSARSSASRRPTSLNQLEERILLGDRTLEAPSPAATPQARLAVRGYELREEIGAGALGTTYRAYQPAVGREVAVKVIGAELANAPAFVRRFEAEAELVARLEHPHVVTLYDFWREPDAAYVVTRLFRGGSLADAIRNGPVARGHAVQIVQDVASALALAHRNGVVHGGIEPGCILLDDDGRAYLTDFRFTDAGDVAHDITDLAAAVTEALPDDARAAAADVLERAPLYPDVAAFADAVQDALGERPVGDEPATVTNPYKGLRAFDEGDTLDFFGRERLVERLLARLGERRDAGAVPGRRRAQRQRQVERREGRPRRPRSGAGRCPVRRRGSWSTSRPGPTRSRRSRRRCCGSPSTRPPSLLEELTAGPAGIGRALRRVLPDDGSLLVLVVDQFEELYTHARPETARSFLEALATAVSDPASRLRVVVTLRADFYDRPLRQRAIGEHFRRGTEVVTPMSPEEIARAITGPAERMGVRFEPGVVAEIVSDVADRAGALPLLQYALTELFDRRRGRTIDLAVYREAGGAAGALVRRAEALYAEFDGETREADAPGAAAAGDPR